MAKILKYTKYGSTSDEQCGSFFLLFLMDRFPSVRTCNNVCVCVSYDSFWTSSSLDVPARVTQEEGQTGGRSHKIFHPPSFCGGCLNFSREKDSAIPFPRRP